MSITRDCRGTTAVQMAIVSLVMIVLFFGIIETGLLIQAQISLNYAVETAARCVAIMGGAKNSPCPISSASTIQSYAKGQFVNLSSNVAPTFTYSTPANGCGQQVSATYPFASVVNLIPYHVTLSSSACFPS
ncbi:MAG: pilus assembly protein [Acetobacteraceae bacterium]|nr:pilus assembly protein [Acetobacteraceae bacterium]